MAYELHRLSISRDFPISRELPRAPALQTHAFSISCIWNAVCLYYRGRKRRLSPGTQDRIVEEAIAGPSRGEKQAKMSSLSRRQALTRIAQAAGAASFASLLSPANFLFAAAAGAPQARRNDLPTGEENAAMFRIGRNFLGQFFAPALSVAIVRDSKFVYERPWGMADTKQHVECSNTSLFRIASVTKPITSVAIFTLLEQGKLNLNDKVFGPSGILAFDYGKDFRQYVTDVTVDHLLTHTSGGWPNDDTDPMFKNNSWDHKKLITESIATIPLTYPPRTHWAYSNFGYCILVRVSEKSPGQTYENFDQQSVLAPCGITDMRIAGNSYRDRALNEVEYLGQF